MDCRPLSSRHEENAEDLANQRRLRSVISKSTREESADSGPRTGGIVLCQRVRVSKPRFFTSYEMRAVSTLDHVHARQMMTEVATVSIVANHT